MLKIWFWFKKYFWIPLTSLLLLLIYLLKDKGNIKKVFKVSKESLTKQKETLEQIGKEEKRQKEKLEDKYVKNLIKLEEEYRRKLNDHKKFSEKKQEEILNTYKDEELARKTAEILEIDFLVSGSNSR